MGDIVSVEFRKDQFKIYTDDSKVIAEVREDGSNLQRDIIRIKECGDKWAMCLNGGKRKIMHFGIKNPDR